MRTKKSSPTLFSFLIVIDLSTAYTTHDRECRGMHRLYSLDDSKGVYSHCIERVPDRTRHQIHKLLTGGGMNNDCE
jgi:hypothetical protein